MPSYVLTGASRGIGWEFLRNLSSNPANTVIGLVRNKPATETRVAEELPGRPNIHILQADITSYKALETAAADTASITGGGLDYLIANAALVSGEDAFAPIGVLGQAPEALEKVLLATFQTNTVAQIHLFNLFTPLILRGSVKKVIAISSGHADTEFVNRLDLATSVAYAISKVALNMAVAKFSVQYKKDGVLFLSVCPGMVDTGHFDTLTEEQRTGFAGMMQMFKEYSPTFDGPRKPEDSVKDLLSVVESASVEENGGGFLSHKGNQIWL